MTAKYTCTAKWMGFIACLGCNILLFISPFFGSYLKTSSYLYSVFVLFVFQFFSMAACLYLVFFSDRLFQKFKTKFDLRWIVLPFFAIAQYTGLDFSSINSRSHSFYYLLFAPIVLVFLSALILFRGNTIVKTILFVLTAVGAGYWFIAGLLTDFGNAFTAEKISIIWTVAFTVALTVLYFLSVFASGKSPTDNEAKPVSMQCTDTFKAPKSVFLSISKWIGLFVCVLMFLITNIATFQLVSRYLENGSYLFALLGVTVCFLPLIFTLYVLFFSTRLMEKYYAAKFDIRWFVFAGMLIFYAANAFLWGYYAPFVAGEHINYDIFVPLSLLLYASVLFNGKKIVKDILVIISSLCLSICCILLPRICISGDPIMNYRKETIQFEDWGTANLKGFSNIVYGVLVGLIVLSVVFYFIGSAKAAKALHESAPEAAPETAPEQ